MNIIRPKRLIQVNIKPVNNFRFIVNKTYNSIIPLKIYQTWYTKDLPCNMKNNIENLKAVNPEFEHFLFDDTDCRNFIIENFPIEVLDTWDRLKAGAYKADLWRYCILYINGGIYLDIKFKCVNGFKLIALTEKERFPTDVVLKEYPNELNKAVYNGFMMSLPKNEILLEAINKIVENVNNKYYGNSPLDITGPVMFGKFFSSDYKKKSAVRRYVGNQGNGISIQNIIILDEYPEYRNEQKNVQVHYNILWKNRDIYY
jgi:mannosyltransferase OCH1-like enzyme